MSEIQLYLGDCLELIKSISNNSIDAVITDPPYGIDYQSAWRTDKSQWKPKIAGDKEPFVGWMEDAFRVLKDGGCILCFCRWDVENFFREQMESTGLSVKSQIIWDKVVHGMGDLKSSFAPVHENILFATKGNFIFPTSRPKTIIREMRVDAEKLVHPNEKPIGLLVNLIKSTTKEGDTILDPFSGSGSTLLGAIKSNRNAIGFEIDRNYYLLQEQRIAQAQADLGQVARPLTNGLTQQNAF